MKVRGRCNNQGHIALARNVSRLLLAMQMSFLRICGSQELLCFGRLGTWDKLPKHSAVSAPFILGLVPIKGFKVLCYHLQFLLSPNIIESYLFLVC